MGEIGINLLAYMLDTPFELMQRVCVVAMAAYVTMRVKPLRRALSSLQLSWQNQAIAIGFFGLLAISGTHSGLVVDVQSNMSPEWTSGMGGTLRPTQAIIGYRDLMVIVAGLFGGTWVGIGSGLLAGGERYMLGSFAGDASAMSTVLLGLFAGLFRRFFPDKMTSIKSILWLTIRATLLQQLMLFMLIADPQKASALVSVTFFPFLVINSLGCLLFLAVLKDLEKDRIQLDAQGAELRAQRAELQTKNAELNVQSAELRALHAQVEPHFLNNTLTSIQTLVSIDPDKASDCLSHLAAFFNYTREIASENSIPLADELKHLQLYLDFQILRFPDKTRFTMDIPETLLACHVAPRSLQTLVANIFVHARHGKKGVTTIHIEAIDFGETMQLKVIDTGCGIASARLATLGRQEVSSKQGNGSALYQISRSLALAFNGQATLNIESQLGVGTTIIMNIPKRSKPWLTQATNGV